MRRRRLRLDHLLEAGLPVLLVELRVELRVLERRIRARLRNGRTAPRLELRVATLREILPALGVGR